MDNNQFSEIFNDDSWDWDKVLDNIEGFVDEITSYNILVMQNSDPDIRVIEIPHYMPVAQVIQEWFPSDSIQTIVNNLDKETKHMVPYFRIVMKDFGGGATINYKLQNFYRKIGLTGFNPRCSMAMVFGLHALHMLESPMDMPSNFCMTTIDPINFGIIQESRPPAVSVCNIQGMVLPHYLPWECQSLILQYCQSPTAMIVESKIDSICINWDIALHTMFQQREPRIPVNIASAYGASSVQLAIAVATRPCLAASAEHLGLSVSPR